MIETAILCLALNVYHEARGEPLKGQKAVAQVTMNRAGGNPARVCEEVFRPHQFSWANPLTLNPAQRKAHADKFMPRDARAWERAKDVARKAIAGTMRNPVGNANHYHAVYVSPRWAPRMRVIARIGGHVFYES